MQDLTKALIKIESRGIASGEEEFSNLLTMESKIQLKKL